MSKTKIYKVSSVKSLYRFYRIDPYCYLRKEWFMKNSSIVIGLASIGLFSNVFVLLAGEGLKNNTADMFTGFGSLAFCAAFILFLIGQKSEQEVRSERDEIYRDFDAVYRHIDDTVRDLRDDIRDCSRECSKDSCSVSKKR
jgi:hypothetical protein